MKERIIIRVLIPECTLEEAVKIKRAIDQVVKGLAGATVELSTASIRPR